jgi:cytochrome P450
VVMDGVGVRIMLPGWLERLPLPLNRRFMRARNAAHATISKAVADLRSTGHDTGDMLSMCIGDRFAMTELTMGLATIPRRCDWSWLRGRSYGRSAPHR